jgi:hypothetical protein
MPDVGTRYGDARVLAWRKRKGDTIEEGEPICLVDADGMRAEVASPASGTVARIRVGVGAIVRAARRSRRSSCPYPGRSRSTRFPSPSPSRRSNRCRKPSRSTWRPSAPRRYAGSPSSTRSTSTRSREPVVAAACPEMTSWPRSSGLGAPRRRDPYPERIAEELPFIDEHALEVGAPAAATWTALLRTVGDSFGPGWQRPFARLLGCAESAVEGDPGAAGSTVVGFRVAAARAPALLELRGRHRFSRYSLTFRIEDLPSGRSRAAAVTRAEFPGLHGRLYRAAVIGTRAHVIAVNRILRAVRRRAERG